MLFLGAGLTGIGYLPNVAAGLPSTAGFVGRVVALFFTLALLSHGGTPEALV